MRRAADDQGDLAGWAGSWVAVERTRVAAVRAVARARVVARVRRAWGRWRVGKATAEAPVAPDLGYTVLLASWAAPRRLVLALSHAESLCVVVEAARRPVADAVDVEGRIAGGVVRGCERWPLIFLESFGVLGRRVGWQT